MYSYRMVDLELLETFVRDYPNAADCYTTVMLNGTITVTTFDALVEDFMSAPEKDRREADETIRRLREG